MRTCANCGTKNKNSATFCQECGVKSNYSYACPKCGLSYKDDVKFCIKCGEKIQQSKIEKVSIEEMPVPGQGITIEFRYSGGRDFPLAVNEAEKHKSFTKIGFGKNAYYRVTFQKNQLREIRRMLDQLHYFRYKKVYLNGERKIWGYVFNYCFIGKLESGEPEEYCFGEVNSWERNFWGCRKREYLNLDHLRYQYNHNWCWGKFDEMGNFIFDKKRIKKTLEAGFYGAKDCPALDKQFAMEALKNFPDVVNPIRDKDWAYVNENGDTVNDADKDTIFKDGKVMLTEDGAKILRRSPEKKGDEITEWEGGSPFKIVGVAPKDEEYMERVRNKIITVTKQKIYAMDSRQNPSQK